MGGKRMRDEAGIAYGGVYLGQRTWMVKLSSAMVCIYLLPVLSGKNTSAYWDFWAPIYYFTQMYRVRFASQLSYLSPNGHSWQTRIFFTETLAGDRPHTISDPDFYLHMHEPQRQNHSRSVNSHSGTRIYINNDHPVVSNDHPVVIPVLGFI